MTLLEYAILFGVLNAAPMLLLRTRERWGARPLFIFVGALQLLQVISAGYFVPLGPHLKMGLGSAFIYPWTLAGVLFVHRFFGPSDARTLVYGLLYANAFISSVLTLSGLLISAGGLEVFGNATDRQLQYNAVVLFWGTFLLFLESLLVPVLFELCRSFTRHFPAQVFLTLATCLLFDSVLFPAVAFAGTPVYPPLFFGTLVGKLVQAAIISSLSPVLAATKVGHETTPLRLGPVLRFLLFDMNMEEMITASYKDPLTNLWNRRYFEAALAYEWSRGIRSKSPLALMTLDLDYLKQLNDTFGHAAGDWALQCVGQAIRQVARRESDCAARIGGDEFALLLPNTPEAEAEGRAKRLLELVSATLPPPEHRNWPRLSVSVGVAVVVPSPIATPQDLLRSSDEALYKAKQEGRGRWVSAIHPDR